jgi:hypothetical protein
MKTIVWYDGPVYGYWIAPSLEAAKRDKEQRVEGSLRKVARIEIADTMWMLHNPCGFRWGFETKEEAESHRDVGGTVWETPRQHPLDVA